MKDFINHHREQFTGNNWELKYMKIKETEYQDETPIWWHTYKHFLYPMVNRASRLMDVVIIIQIDFFIDHLHRHIERFHWEQLSNQNFDNSCTVYREQRGFSIMTIITKVSECSET